MHAKGIFRLGEEVGFDAVVLDELDAGGWHKVKIPGSHWPRGFPIARPALEGVQSPDQIELVGGDAQSEEYAAQIRAILAQG